MPLTQIKTVWFIAGWVWFKRLMIGLKLPMGSFSWLRKKNIHRRSSIFDVHLLVCLPRAPNTGATNENPPRVLPPTPSRGARPVRASDTSTWRSASGQRLCGSSTPPHPIPFHGTPVQLWHRVESAGRRSLVHWPVTHSPRSATATIIADTLL